MSSIALELHETPQKRWIFWIGWAVSLWPVFSWSPRAPPGSWKPATPVVRGGVCANRLAGELLESPGLPATRLRIALFLIPRTAVLGAILLTGYLGGAIATYVRIGEPYPVLVPLSTSMIAWAGLYLRDQRLRSLIPFRRS